MVRTISLSIVLCLSAFGADWPRWRGPNGDGISPESVNTDSWDKEGPRRVWKAKVGVGFTAATVADGRLFTLGNVDKSDTATLWCLNAETGALLWKKDWPSKLEPAMYEGGQNSTPVVVDSRLFVVIKPATVACLESASGKLLWEKDVHAELHADLNPWGIVGAPLIVDGKVILNYGSNGTALDAGSGRVLWSTGKAGASFNVPALALMSGEPTLMVLATNSLVAVQLKDGREQLRVPFGAGYFCHAADPIVYGDSVFIGSADAGSQLIRFSSGKPEIVWQNRSLGNFTATSVFFDGYLYGINLCDSKDSGAELRCLDWKTGALKWAEKGYGQGSFLCAGNKMLLLSDKGELTVARFSPDRFELLRRDQVIGGKCWTPPSLARGKLYVRNAAGDLICLDLSSVKAG